MQECSALSNFYLKGHAHPIGICLADMAWKAMFFALLPVLTQHAPLIWIEGKQ